MRPCELGGNTEVVGIWPRSAAIESFLRVSDDPAESLVRLASAALPATLEERSGTVRLPASSSRNVACARLLIGPALPVEAQVKGELSRVQTSTEKRRPPPVRMEFRRPDTDRGS